VIEASLLNRNKAAIPLMMRGAQQPRQWLRTRRPAQDRVLGHETDDSSHRLGRGRLLPSRAKIVPVGVGQTVEASGSAFAAYASRSIYSSL